MATGSERWQSRERLRVGARFLRLRPLIALPAALGNALLLSASAAPTTERLALAACLGLTVSAFVGEAIALGRRGLSDRWLRLSLTATLAALGAGALLSGGLLSPFVPLLFAPVVVGFAAFARARSSVLLLAFALATCVLLALLGPLRAFPVLPQPILIGMLSISCTASLLLLALGVTELVDARERIAGELERLRADTLEEARRRASSVEHLGATVAHEVKNPLTAARGLVELVARHLSGPGQHERDGQRLGVVVTEIDRALAVLADYLSFAKPLSDLTLDNVELGPLLEDVARVLEAHAEKKGIEIRLMAEPLSLLGDRQRLRDALLNLALNAVTALPRGGRLELSAARAGDRARLGVSDDGPGISAELLARLGQAFTSESEGGTGLGVLLAQSVARQHGGDLTIESAPGAGARAILELPLRGAARS